MTYKICYWDAEAKEQKERDATPEEVAEIEERRTKAAQQQKFDRIEQIKNALDEIDRKRVRPLAEGDAEWLGKLNAQAVTFREELKQLNEEVRNLCF